MRTTFGTSLADNSSWLEEYLGLMSAMDLCFQTTQFRFDRVESPDAAFMAYFMDAVYFPFGFAEYITVAHTDCWRSRVDSPADEA